MFQVREEDNGCFIQEKVYMPLLRQQNLLQTKNKSQKSEDRLMRNDKKIQEMNVLEQNLQNILFQKQAFELELDETTSALNEIEKSGDEVFKIIGQLMIKTEKSRIKDELLEKKKILDMRIRAFEKQENYLKEKLDKIREEISSSLKK